MNEMITKDEMVKCLNKFSQAVPVEIYRNTVEKMNPGIRALPSPCTAFSQSLSVNSFRWRIRGERAGNTNSHFRMDHVTRNALAARKNEA